MGEGMKNKLGLKQNKSNTINFNNQSNGVFRSYLNHQTRWNNRNWKIYGKGEAINKKKRWKIEYLETKDTDEVKVEETI